jgi:hypothetical protein
VGTLGWLSEQYYKSPQFAVIDKRQQRVRQLVMRAMLDEPTKEGSKYRFYDCPISEFTSDHVRLLRNRRKDAPSVANPRVGELRKMFAWGVEECSTWVKRNIASDVATLQYQKEGFRAWRPEDVAQFEAYWLVHPAPRGRAHALHRGQAFGRRPAWSANGQERLDHLHAPKDAAAKESADPADLAGASGRNRQDADRWDEDLPRDATGKSVHRRRVRQLVQGEMRHGWPEAMRRARRPQDRCRDGSGGTVQPRSR